MTRPLLPPALPALACAGTAFSSAAFLRRGDTRAPSLASRLLALACAGTAFSSAAFIGRGDTGASSFASGRLAITSDRDGQAVLDASGMRPGQMREGTLTVTNDGDVDAHFSLVADDLGSDALARTVALAVDDCTHGCGGGP